MFCTRAMLSILLLAAPLAQAADYRVGPGCPHTSLQSALTAAAGTPSAQPHRIRIAAAELQVVDLVVENPLADIIIEGGYASCSAAESTGITTLRKPANPVNGKILDLRNNVNADRRTITLRKLTLTGARQSTFGALTIVGHLTVVLQGAVTIKDNTSSGVYMFNLLAEKRTRLVMEGEGAGIFRSRPVISGNSATNGAGIVAHVSEIRMYDGLITNNSATSQGGGMLLNGSHLIIDRRGWTAVQFSDNTAISASNTSGLGGAIYGSNSTITTGSSSAGRYAVTFNGNEANHGGAIYLTNNNSTTRRTSHFKSAQFIGNTARGKGGAIQIVNGIDLLVEHTEPGGMCTGGTGGIFPIPPETPVHCSRMVGNVAENTFSGAGTLGGGAISMITEPDAPPAAVAEAQILRTVFDDNHDVAGWAGAIASNANTRLTVSASVFTNHSTAAGGSVLETRGPHTVLFLYNTVLGEVRPIFAGQQTVSTRGSILWTLGTPGVVGGSGVTHDFGSCLLSSSALAGAVTADPQLDAGFHPRGRSPAIDVCPNLLVPGQPPGNLIQVPPLPDLYFRDRDRDVAGVANSPGFNDLGAVEQVDIIYYGGFGTKPNN